MYEDFMILTTPVVFTTNKHKTFKGKLTDVLEGVSCFSFTLTEILNYIIINCLGSIVIFYQQV